MTDGPDAAAPGSADGPDIDELTREILPALIARLRASRLGELEVRTAAWRVRVRRELRAGPLSARSADASADTALSDDEVEGGPARSPAVGYFSPSSRLAVGQLVQAGDSLGSVDMLGIAQDVLAPVAGIVRAVLAEPGQAVEYGQPLVEVDVLALESPTVGPPETDEVSAEAATEPITPAVDRAAAAP
jgi:acetyl-CoA carboxylase biotin carboxyl carrier protein